MSVWFGAREMDPDFVQLKVKSVALVNLACWEHYNPLARYAMMADGEQIHSAMYPGSIFGDLFAQQTEVNIRQHALESACFVVCATAWLDADQQAQIAEFVNELLLN